MNDAAITAGSQEIVVDEVFPHTLDVVWKTLTTPGMMGRWLKMEPTGFEPKVGTHFTYQTMPAGEWDGIIHCRVLEVTPNERLAYAWKSGDERNVGYGSRLDTIVTWTLTEVDSGTRLRLVHSGFVTPKNDSAFNSMGGAWPFVVQSVGNIAGELH